MNEVISNCGLRISANHEVCESTCRIALEPAPNIQPVLDIAPNIQPALAEERDIYLDSLLERLNTMMQMGTLCDTYLALPDGTYRSVHWAVMSNLRPQLDKMFTRTIDKNDSYLLAVKDLTPARLDIVVELAYSGKAELTMSNIQDVVIVASYLEMYDVLYQCEAFLVQQLTASNCITLADYSLSYGFERLRTEAFKFVLKNFSKVVETNPKYLTELGVDDLCCILEDDRLNARREETVFHALLKWIDYDPRNRKSVFPRLVSKIRTGLVTPSFLYTSIMKHPFVKDMAKEVKDLAFGYDVVKGRPRIPRTILLAMLGWSGGSTTPLMEGYDPRAQRWFFVPQRTEFFVSRAYHGAVCMGGQVYVVGGFDGHLCYNTVVRFDPRTLGWTERSPLLEFRCYVSCVALADRLYAMGGFNGEWRCRSCERYHPARNEWRFVAPMLERRSDAAAAVHRGKIFMCGGFNGLHVLTNAEVYDPELDQWTLVASMHTPRSGHQLASFSGHLYAIAGFDGAHRLQSVERYDAVRSKWVPSLPIIHPRSNFASAVLEGDLYVIGGFDGSTTFASVERLDADQHTWRNVADLCIHRSALSVCVLHDMEDLEYYHANALPVKKTQDAEPFLLNAEFDISIDDI